MEIFLWPKYILYSWTPDFNVRRQMYMELTKPFRL